MPWWSYLVWPSHWVRRVGVKWISTSNAFCVLALPWLVPAQTSCARRFSPPAHCCLWHKTRCPFLVSGTLKESRRLSFRYSNTTMYLIGLIDSQLCYAVSAIESIFMARCIQPLLLYYNHRLYTCKNVKVDNQLCVNVVKKKLTIKNASKDTYEGKTSQSWILWQIWGKILTNF